MNGRQPLGKFLDQLPLDRVWEVHLAGGFELDGFYLDAHSGAIPEPLHAVVEEIIPNLPNLKAIVFETFSSFIPIVGLDLVREQLEWLHAVWERRTSAEGVRPKLTPIRSEAEKPHLVSPAVWERALRRLVVGENSVGPDPEAIRQVFPFH